MLKIANLIEEAKKQKRKERNGIDYQGSIATLTNMKRRKKIK
jgi:hypothetical protein